VAARVLLTGATGFLGRQVLRELLARARRSDCLVRAADDREADARLDGARRGGWADPACARAPWRCAATLAREPRAGRAYRGDRIAHRPFTIARRSELGEALLAPARANVPRTLEVRASPARRAPSRSRSSRRSRCASRGTDATVDEMSDMSPSLERMPLGYARSKCVAESLLRQAARRGLPVTIVRPGLLAGDTATGAAIRRRGRRA
jgi:nucleoside-diphosphate-sugar epimerase